MRSQLQRIFVVLVFINFAFAENVQVSAPRSSTIVMVDGRLSATEWKDAARVEVLRFELTTITSSNENTSSVVFPPRTRDHDPTGWLELALP